MYSLSILDCKNRKMTEILMMILTAQLRKKEKKNKNHIPDQSINPILILESSLTN